MQGGWIKIHRSLMSWEWWDDAVMVKAFLSILMMCGSDETRWHGQTLPAGSFVTSRAKLAGVLGLTEKQTRTVLSRLTETGEITTRTNNHCTIVIVNNWADYQLQKTDKNGQPEQFDFQRINADFQNKRADQGPTKGQQKANQGPTEGHKQEEKNIYPPLLSKESIPPQGEMEKPKRKVFVKPTVEEVAAYCRERGNNIDPQAFVDHYERVGWVCGKSRQPMKDWKAGIRLWEKYEKQNHASNVLHEYGFAPDESGTGKAEWETENA